ncbi:hypothetical protein F5Y09DRAFT_350741 [Xylaria sp. FL1042]|nr:hypothetical protein F5Y09DRAFT_350741 [Xylaria sp. FL1042]
MRYISLVLLGGTAAFLFDKNPQLDLAGRTLDMTAGGYDKHPKTNFETTNGTSPARQILGNALNTRDECNNGIVDCPDYQCDKCGSCCGDGTCAENFGNCCSEDTHCSFGFSCCSSGCCYEDTSLCCDSSPTGCCVKGTQCTPDGCVGDPAFLVESVTVTTTFTSVIYYTSTVVDTAVTTNMGVTTEFVTSTVTRDNVDVATVTNYVTSTKIAKRTLPENPKRTERPWERKHHPTPPTPIPTTARGLVALRDNLESIGLLPKRDVTSYIYDYVFIWDTITSDIFETSTVASEIDSMSTQFSTITSILFEDAKSTTTVLSTVVVTSTQVATSSPESSTKETPSDPVTTKTSNQIVVMTTFVVGVTNSGDSEAAVATAVIDGGGASDLEVATGISSRSDSSSPLGSNTVAPTSSSTEVGVSNKKSELSTGAKAGIGAGAGAAGLALLGALVFFALGKRRRPNSTISGDNSQAPAAPSAVSNWTPPPPPARYSHLDGREVSYTERAAALARSMETMHRPSSMSKTPNFQGYQQSGSFSPSSQGVSPSTPSELYKGTQENVQEMGGSAENMRWYMGPNTIVHHEISEQHYHEMPSTPQPSHSQHARQGPGW